MLTICLTQYSRYDDPNPISAPPPKGPFNAGAVAGGSLAGLVIVGLGGFGVIYMCARRTTHNFGPPPLPKFPLWKPSAATRQPDPTYLYSSIPDPPAQSSEPSYLRPNPATDTLAANADAATSSGDELLHQLQDHQDKLVDLRKETLQYKPWSYKAQSAVQSQAQAEEVKLEVERLRELITSMGITPPIPPP
jgi:hypothetical protein